MDKNHGVALAIVYVVEFDWLAIGIAADFDEVHKTEKEDEERKLAGFTKSLLSGIMNDIIFM